MTPISTNKGATRPISNDSTCTISVVPRLAPSMIARAGTRSTSPPAAKLAAISPVAVLLCNTAVTPSPARNARQRSPRVRPRKRRRLGPKARWMPLCTMCRPHSNSAIAPARSIRDRVAFIFPSLRLSGSAAAVS